MEEQELTPAMQDLIEQMAQIRTELASLKERSSILTPPVSKGQTDEPIGSTNRRKVLRRLAGGLVAGLALAGTAAVSLPQQAPLIKAIVSTTRCNP